ncbi:Protein aubergine [Orchesella cincta]|uniref:Protein aubergine n=1 Tax=Orchesella cincta TaxID=48709 RepID=A0A1D2MG36_ORCCI|nr:Protein aubergine [Orchesella cincta]
MINATDIINISFLTANETLFLQSSKCGRERIELNIRLVSELRPTDVMYLQLFNILVRKCLEAMNLEEMGRHFYDRHQAIRINAHKLELWPGYKTSMRNHENDILLGVEITHKVLRLDSCLDVINNIFHRSNDQVRFKYIISNISNRVKHALVGSIVMTSYNRKTYRIDDIEWDMNPTKTFDMQGKETSFIEYFKTKYGQTIRDPHQPMLVSRPKKKDLHRGQAGPILLIPELCQMTGLTDEMRANNQLMRALATHLHTDPSARVAKLNDFMHRLQTIPTIVEELNRWGLKFERKLVELKGHVIPKENILFGKRTLEVPNDRYDWNSAFRGKPMYSSVDLKHWVVVTPGSAAWCVEKMVNNMQRVSRPLEFNISTPMPLHRISSDRPNDYAKGVDDVMNQYKNSLQLLFVILPKQANDTYAAVKKRATLEFGVPSQCFVARNAQNDKSLMSICTKLVVQMNAKLGGEPWTVLIPLKKLMVVGFDVYHCGKRKGSSVGAMVATTSASYAKYFSTVSHHSSRDELSDKVGADFMKGHN